MYILKNAVRSIVRSPGRTTIICLIVTAISMACCVALSIQQSSVAARITSANALTIRGHIKADRKFVMETLQAAQENAEASEDETEAQASMEETLKSISGLSLEEMQTYAQAESVKRFYYYTTIAVCGDNGLTPLNQEDHSEVQNAITNAMDTSSRQGGPGQGPGGKPGGPGGQGGGGMDVEGIIASINFGGDFILYGYSADEALEDFSSGTCYITSGRMFEEGTTEYTCILNEELAAYNSLKVGDQITLSNPAARSERFTLTIVGLYKNTQDTSGENGKSSDDPANHILTSYAVVHDIAEKSKYYQDPSAIETIKTLEDGTVTEQLLQDDGQLVVKGGEAVTSDEESESALSESATGTYVFDSIEAFDSFEEQARALGLSENYTTTSSDVASYEASLVPLENLSTYANSFLYIVLGIGAVILIGVNVFNIRERKYEIGALTAMGMRKGKVAIQFVLELTIVTFMGIMIGSLIGSVASPPVANALLASQIEYEQENSEKMQTNFGREVSEASAKPHGGDVEGEVEYVSTVSFTFDYVIVYKMMIIGALLALVSSTAAIGFVLRYNPLEILAERD